MEVRRKNHETASAMLRRFTRKIQQSKMVLRARKLRYRQKSLTPRAQKEKALRIIDLRAETVRLEKLGKSK